MIHTSLKSFRLDLNKLVGFDADGCSTMLGDIDGVPLSIDGKE